MASSAEMERLAGSLAGGLGLPGSEIYDAGRQVWHPAARTRSPIAVVRPQGESDVVAALRWAKDAGLRVSPRSGGHAFDGFSVRDNTVLLDLSAMAASHIDAEGLLHVQPGARILSLAERLDKLGRAAPTGDCPAVGIGGLVTGGGFGYATRVFGLTLDNLVEVNLVTARGELLRASPERHRELFWACCGGGAAAGVVTEMVLRTFAVERVTAVEIAWSWERAQDVLLAYDRIMRDAPRKLDLKLKIRTTGPERFMDREASGPVGSRPGIPFIHIDGQYLGRQAEAEPLLKPLIEAIGCKSVTLREESYFEAATQLVPLAIINDPAPASLRPFRVASDFTIDSMAPSEAAAIVRFIDDTQNAPGFWGGAILIEPADGAVCERPSRASAFPHRKQRLLLEWEIFHPLQPTSDEQQRLDACLGRARAGLQRILSGGRYLNYADRLDRPQHWWGGNLERLTAIADAVDPQQTLVSRLYPGANPDFAD